MVFDKKDKYFLVLISLFAPLFFYKLGNVSLTSFDEAWYADISRNVILNRDLFNISWNGKPFYDHPPASFWLTAISYLFFGINTYSARFSQALLGFLSVFVVYFLGKNLFSRKVGFLSAVALPSSFWFLLRSRSGNLDITLTFFFILTFLLALKTVENKKYLYAFAASLGLLFLSKTLVPLTILPLLLIVFFQSKLNLKDYLKILIVFLIVVLPYFVINYYSSPEFVKRVFQIGLVGVKTENDYFENIKLVKDYIYFGIGRWFWPAFISILISPIIFLVNRQKRFLYIPVFFVSFLFPFVFSQKGHIWHLIPVHPFMFLSLFLVASFLLEKILKFKYLVFLLLLIFTSTLSFIQIKRSFNEFIDVPQYISDIEILSKEASRVDGKFYVDGDYAQEAIFYSGKNVHKISNEEIVKLFTSKDKFLLITKQNRISDNGINQDQYEIISSDRDKVLVKNKI